MTTSTNPKNNTSGLSLSFFSPSSAATFKVKTLVLPLADKLNRKGNLRFDKVDNSG